MAILQKAELDQIKEAKWLLLGGACALYTIYTILFAKFFSPLAAIPGDFFNKVSGIRWNMALFTQNKMYLVQDSFDRYQTPIVQVAPNKVAIRDASEFKTIYGTQDWRKSHFYTDFADFNNTSSLFSETNPQRVSMLRRAFLPAFSRANLVAMSKHIFSHIDKLLIKLEEFDRRGEPLEAYRWFRYLTFQVVTDLGFGADYDMISEGEKDHPFVQDFDGAVTWGVAKSIIPFADRVPKLLLPAGLRHWSLSEQRTVAHAKDGLDKWRKQRAQGATGHRVDIIQRIIDHGEKNPEDKLTERELITEIMEIMLAGGDTTATTVTYACYEFAKNPEVQERLRAALKEGIPDLSAPCTIEQLEAIPYLDWTIKEMLRTHPTVPSALERVVPPGGATICSHRLPAGTIVCAQAWTNHKLADVFVDPLAFRPERWEHETSQMKLNLVPFGVGARSCVGQNLAIMQMKIHVAMILRRFKIELGPGTTPESMKTVDIFQGKPVSEKCMLYFKLDK